MKEVWTTVVAFVVCGAALAFAICTYLDTSYSSDPGADGGEGSGHYARVRALVAELDRRGRFKLASTIAAVASPSLWREASSLLKVVLGFCQLIEVFSRFDYVDWPNLFEEYMEFFSLFHFEFLNFIRLDCYHGKPVRFYCNLNYILI